MGNGLTDSINMFQFWEKYKKENEIYEYKERDNTRNERDGENTKTTRIH